MTRVLSFVAAAILAFGLGASGLAAHAAQDVPTGPPDAVVDLTTHEGTSLVKGEWRYSDTKIIEVDFKAAGPDGQPTGKPNRAYSFEPHAGGADFDDSKWEVIDYVA